MARKISLRAGDLIAYNSGRVVTGIEPDPRTHILEVLSDSVTGAAWPLELQDGTVLLASVAQVALWVEAADDFTDFMTPQQVNFIPGKLPIGHKLYEKANSRLMRDRYRAVLGEVKQVAGAEAVADMTARGRPLEHKRSRAEDKQQRAAAAQAAALDSQKDAAVDSSWQYGRDPSDEDGWDGHRLWLEAVFTKRSGELDKFDFTRWRGSMPQYPP